MEKYRKHMDKYEKMCKKGAKRGFNTKKMQKVLKFNSGISNHFQDIAILNFDHVTVQSRDHINTYKIPENETIVY